MLATLEMIKGFFIRYTIPTLLDKEIFKGKLSKRDFLDLQEIIRINTKLIAGIEECDEELIVIRRRFLEIINGIAIENEPINLLPVSLKYITAPPLKSLTLHFIRRKGISEKELETLTEELREALKNPAIKKREPFGRLSAEEAYNNLMKLRELLVLEVDKAELNTQQILDALKVSVITSCTTEKYISMLKDLTECSNELLNIMSWAIKLNNNKVFFRLIDLQPDFKIGNHVEYFLPTAVEYTNTKIFNFLFGYVDRKKLVENTFLLHSSAKSGQLAMVNQFLELKFDHNKKNKIDLLAIHYAAIVGSIPVYELLLPYVKKNLTKIDYFNLFRCAAINNNLDIIRHFVMSGLDINIKNLDNETILEAVGAKLNECTSKEVKYWGKIFSSFEELNITIKFLLDNMEPIGTSKINIGSSIIDRVEEVADSNIHFKRNIKPIISHPVILRDISIYQRYFSQHKIKKSLVITFFSFLIIGTALTASLGIAEKFNAKVGRFSGGFNNDDQANILLMVGGLLILVDALLLTVVFVPRSKIPCTHFFRNNPSVERNPCVDQASLLNSP